MNAHKQKNTAKTKTSLRSEKGMTLIDVAVALMVTGLLATPVLYALKEYKREIGENTTIDNLALIEEAIDRYYIENDHFPCPADITLATTDAGHGTGLVNSNVPPDACDLANPVLSLSNGVIQGAVPHKDLGINLENTYDGYGNKILYVVTAAMASTPDADTQDGAIQINQEKLVPHPTVDILDDDLADEYMCAGLFDPYPAPSTVPPSMPDSTEDFYGTSPIQQTNNVTFTLVSHGRDGRGAYDRFGNTQACDINTVDSENCNGDHIFLLNDNACSTNTSDTDDRYDDILMERSDQNTYTAASGSGVPSRMFEESDSNSVGGIARYTGINNDYPEHELDVVGNILISDTLGDSSDDKNAAALSEQYCNVDGSDCFSSDLIGGTSPRMQCGGGTGMTGIGNNRARCRRQFSEGAAATPCPDGQFVVSLNEGGFVCGP